MGHSRFDGLFDEVLGGRHKRIKPNYVKLLSRSQCDGLHCLLPDVSRRGYSGSALKALRKSGGEWGNARALAVGAIEMEPVGCSSTARDLLYRGAAPAPRRLSSTR
ncbi:hypothetical protein IE4771_PB00079 (plasmid) [Rhizobium etli bv. mimosae str. IE4771]|uniref:Uncharacterized protein n=1 Tax=Rhizobium etli bv. mimosae str. IE4771 TaxID=1432050 RepID=A0A060I3T2_RHIET|nr:hypothetical protein IE4771_PB00079 [Rhizobium sp. IE4771]